MLHHESHVPAHVALRITLVANLQWKTSSFLVTILKKSAKLPPPLQQYQWLRPTEWPRRPKITEKELEVGLTLLTHEEVFLGRSADCRLRWFRHQLPGTHCDQ